MIKPDEVRGLVRLLHNACFGGIMPDQDIPLPSSLQPLVQYRDIIGFPGYRVGDDGSIWSRRSKNGIGPLRSEWRRLRPSWMGDYLVVCLRDAEKKRRNYQIHGLILLAFTGPRPPGMWALHKNDDREDNRLSNLYWGTPTDNARDRRVNGHERTQRGTERHNAKLSEEAVVRIRKAAAAGASVIALACEHDVTEAAIRKACSGGTWSHVSEPTVDFSLIDRPRKTHCKNGHAMEGDNLHIMPNGYRKCRACGREVAKRQKIAHRERINEWFRKWRAKKKQS